MPQYTDRVMSHFVMEFLLAKEASGRRPDTIDSYRTRLGRLVEFLNDPPISSVRAAEIRRWLVFLKLGRVRTTTGVYVDGHRVLAFMFFKWLARNGVLKRSPMERVDRFLVDRPAVRTLTRDQIQLLLNGQSNSPTGRRNRVMLAFMYDTGIRLAELTRLRVQDVDLSTRLARIESKTRSVDVIPLSAALCKELEAYVRNDRSISHEGTDALFTSAGGKRGASPNSMRLWLRRAKSRVGLGQIRVSPQVIRSTSATHLAAMGASAFELQRFLRHTTVRMSQRYVNLAALDVAHDSPFQSLANGRDPRRPSRGGAESRFGVSIAHTRTSDIAQLRSFQSR